MNILELLAKELQEKGFHAEYKNTPVSESQQKLNYWKENIRPVILITFFTTYRQLNIFRYMVWQSEDHLHADDFRYSDEKLCSTQFRKLTVDYRDPNSITDIIEYLITKRQDVHRYGCYE